MGPPPLVACHLRRSVEARLLATSRQSRLSRSRCRLCRRSASSLSLSLFLLRPHFIPLLSLCSRDLLSSRSALEKRSVWDTRESFRRWTNSAGCLSRGRADATAAEGHRHCAAYAHADRNRVAGRLRRRRDSTAREWWRRRSRCLERPPLSIGRLFRETISVVDRRVSSLYLFSLFVDVPLCLSV